MKKTKRGLKYTDEINIKIFLKKKKNRKENVEITIKIFRQVRKRIYDRERLDTCKKYNHSK